MGMMTKIIADRRIIRASAKSVRHILLDIDAPCSADEEVRRPVNFVVALDTSGSMEGKKLSLAKEAIVGALDRLGSRDGFAFVNFARDGHTVVPYTRASPAATDLAKVAIADVWSGGMTNLGDGLLHAFQEFKNLDPDAVNRCLILTDGETNRGLTELGDLQALVKAGQRRNITTSTIGMGNDYDDEVLRKIALAGKGNFYRAGYDNEIHRHVEREFGAALRVSARDVTVRISVGNEAKIRLLSDYPVTEHEGFIEVCVGDLVAGQSIELAIEVEFFGSAPGTQASCLHVKVQDRDGTMSSENDVVYQAGSDAEVEAQVPDAAAAFRVSEMFGALATREAVLYNRWSRHIEAQDIIMAAAHAIRERAAGNRPMLTLAEQLERRALEFRKPMLEPARKDWSSVVSLSLRCVVVPVVPKASADLPGGFKRPHLRLVQEKTKGRKSDP
jgi:Ca-activated chloride channel family protein